MLELIRTESNTSACDEVSDDAVRETGVGAMPLADEDAMDIRVECLLHEYAESAVSL